MPLPENETYPKARNHALQALSIDPTQPGAHLALAEATAYNEWNFVSAEHSYKRALELDPNLARAHLHYGWLLDATERFDEAEAEFRLASDLAPLEPLYSAWYGWWLMGRGQNERALEQANKSLALVESFPPGLYVIGAIAAAEEQFDDAISIHENLVRMYPGEWEWALGATYALAGRPGDAERLIAQHQEDNSAGAWTRAITQCHLGNADGAFEALKAAVRHRNSMVPWLKQTYFCGDLVADPRFEFLTAAVNYGVDP